MNGIDYNRLSYLGERVRAGIASPVERDEYMYMLYRNGNLSEQQYKSYTSGGPVDEIVKAALAVGAVLLIGYLLTNLFDRR